MRFFYKYIYNESHLRDILALVHAPAYEYIRMELFCDVALDYGDITTLTKIQELENISSSAVDLTTWMYNILSIRNLLTSQQLGGIYSMPFFNNLMCGGNMILLKTKKITIYKLNLQILTGKKIYKPKFIYYNVVIIFTFLLKNPNLICLNSDIVKQILWYILHTNEN